MRTVVAADLFCGAGGTSSGLMRAAADLGAAVELTAVNHWPTAVETHTANHPGARHYCADLDALDPRLAVPGGKLDLLVASPECTHFATARGAKPIDDQKRASPWVVLRWAEALHVSRILIENVPDMQTWGPLNAKGRQIASRKGETFQAFLAALRSLNYRVDWKILNAADYGDAQARWRLFIQARKGTRAVRWPEPTHSEKPDLFGRPRWRAAREVIDLERPSRSVFTRKKALSDKTWRRIMVGLERFGGPAMEPFLVQLRGTATARSINRPLPTVTAGGTHLALVQPQPFVLQQQSGGVARSTDRPLPTVTADGAQMLVQPFLIPFYGERDGQAPRTHSVEEPVPTIPATGAGKFAVVQPFVVQFTHGGRERDIDRPLPTVTCANRGELGVVQPFLTVYNGESQAVPISEPMPTVTGSDRFALVMPKFDGKALDIHLRMLQPDELAAAQGFDPAYKFTGNRGEQVRQIGNAVPVNLARELIRAALEV